MPDYSFSFYTRQTKLSVSIQNSNDAQTPTKFVGFNLDLNL